MKTTPEHNERIAKMTFASVYPHYIKKVESKGRTKEELHQVIAWLTGFHDVKLNELIDQKANFEEFGYSSVIYLIHIYSVLDVPIDKVENLLDDVDELDSERLEFFAQNLEAKYDL